MSREIQFTFDTELLLTVGPDGGEDTIDVPVRLHCGGIPGTPETGRFGAPENYDPGSGDEIWLERVEIGEEYAHLTNAVSEIRVRYLRFAVSGDAAGPNDQAIIDAAERYVDDPPDALVEEMYEAGEPDPDRGRD